jgi:hypothetical protein
MNLALAILVVVAVAAVAITAMLLVRRVAPEGSFFSDGDRASGVFGVLATGFAVLLGFVVFLAFTSYDAARAGAELEALTVAQQVETAQLLPPAAIGELTSELVCYARSVAGIQWERMEDGTLGEELNPWGVEPSCSARCAPSIPRPRPSSRPSTSGSSRPRRGRRPAATASTVPSA